MLVPRHDWTIQSTEEDYAELYTYYNRLVCIWNWNAQVVSWEQQWHSIQHAWRCFIDSVYYMMRMCTYVTAEQLYNKFTHAYRQYHDDELRPWNRLDMPYKGHWFLFADYLNTW